MPDFNVDEHIKVFNAHDANGWASHYAENAVLYDPQYGEAKNGRDAVLKDIQDFFAAFPDIQFNVLGVVDGGNQMAIQGTGAGTHQGSMEGPGGTIPATNKRVEIPFAAFIRVSPQGLIEEERRYYDMAGMMQQLGLMG
jgi:steroid delta-isomerase-like uncharacterized protein